MAEFCVALHITPDQYRNLTLEERDAIAEAFNRAHRK